MKTFVMNNRPLVYMVGAIAALIAIHLGWVEVLELLKKHYPDDPDFKDKVITASTFLWTPLFQLMLWVLIGPIALISIIWFAFLHLTKVTIDTPKVIEVATAMLYAYLGTIIFGLALNLFLNPISSEMIVVFCILCGYITLVATFGMILIYLIYQFMIGLFGNRTALIVAVIIILLIIFSLNTCKRMVVSYEKVRKEVIERSVENGIIIEKEKISNDTTSTDAGETEHEAPETNETNESPEADLEQTISDGGITVEKVMIDGKLTQRINDADPDK